MAYRPFQKRKQKPKLYALAVFIILLALFLSFSGFQNLFNVRSMLSAVVYPFKVGFLFVWGGVTSTSSSLANLGNLSRENAKLEKEIKELKPRLMIMEAVLAENKRLRKTLKYKNLNQRWFKLLAAEVVGKIPAPWFSILEINQGSSSGIKVNSSVLNQEGLVGRVIEVSPFSSKVMLIVDGESSVAARDSRSFDFGVVGGGGLDRLYMKYVSAGKDVKVGDQIVTSPISTIFPPGILIGTVSRASKREHDLFYHIDIKPAVDFSKLENVFVVL